MRKALKLLAGVFVAGLWTAPTVWLTGAVVEGGISTPVIARSAAELEAPAWAALSALAWSLVALAGTLFGGMPALLHSRRKGLTGAIQAAVVVATGVTTASAVVLMVWIASDVSTGHFSVEGVLHLAPTTLVAALMSSTFWVIARDGRVGH